MPKNSDERLVSRVVFVYAVFASLWLTGLGTLFYFVIRALNKYING